MRVFRGTMCTGGTVGTQNLSLYLSKTGRKSPDYNIKTLFYR